MRISPRFSRPGTIKHGELRVEWKAKESGEVCVCARDERSATNAKQWLSFHRDSSMNHYSQPTNATQAKDRLYAQLATSLKNMSRAVGQTADLFEQLQVDLDAMRGLAGIHAAQYVPFEIHAFIYLLSGVLDS